MEGPESSVAKAVGESVAITRSVSACVEHAVLGITASNLIDFDPELAEVRFQVLFGVHPRNRKVQFDTEQTD